MEEKAEMKHTEKNKLKTYDSEFRWYFAGFAIIVLIVCCLPYLLTQKSWLSIGTSKPNEIGDTLGGTLGPFVALVASALTFLAFWVQYKANQQQREQFNQQLSNQKGENAAQEKTWKVEQFESKYYELLKIHRANVEEISIGGVINGRKSFVSMFYEFKFIYHTLENCLPKPESARPLNEKVWLSNIAYKVFFYGVGINSNRILSDFTTPEEKPFVSKLIKQLEAIQEEFNSEKEGHYKEKALKPFAFIKKVTPQDFKLRIRYFPFDGHSTKLGHYYRHLFQIVDYVAKSSLFNYSEQYEYLRTLRAQLSNHEQLLLYYNALSDFGKEWNRRKYFTKYRLIRNIPLPAADFGPSPEEQYANEIAEMRKNGIELFEWHEIMRKDPEQ